MTEKSFQAILEARYTRRDHLSQGLVTAGMLALCGRNNIAAAAIVSAQAGASSTSLTFKEIPHTYDEFHHLPEGYQASVLMRWGDPVLPNAPIFRPGEQRDIDQAGQFGFNNDYIAFMPLPHGSSNSSHGLLCVNHEYPIGYLMFSGYVDRPDAAERMTLDELRAEQQAVGLSIIEVIKERGAWRVVQSSKYARRITPTTDMKMTGPAAGHIRMKTNEDPSGLRVKGTLANCAGGLTPWGTILTCEENLQEFFWGDQEAALQRAPVERSSWQSFGVGRQTGQRQRVEDGDKLARPLSGWSRIHDRFNIEKEPHEPNRFGWVVEIDPYDPRSTPQKRTALGRFRHESATLVVKPGQRVAVYSGDDQEFQFIYRFVSKNAYDANDQRNNRNLLEDGDLYAARFNADGTGEWLKISEGHPIVLDAQERQTNTGDHWAIDARQFAAKLGATPMDRPEDIEISPLTDRVYVALTKNPNRSQRLIDAINPSAKNYCGHIIEIIPPGSEGNRDHISTAFAWNFLLFGGDSNEGRATRAPGFHPATTSDGWFANPDNLAFDPKGRLWVATDGMPTSTLQSGKKQPIQDGLWAMEVTGDGRALAKHFFTGPRGSELTGPCFTPDGKTLFVSVQHPGQEKGSTFDKPSTRWPDFDPKLPPRPSVLAITKTDGAEISS